MLEKVVTSFLIRSKSNSSNLPDLSDLRLIGEQNLSTTTNSRIHYPNHSPCLLKTLPISAHASPETAISFVSRQLRPLQIPPLPPLETAAPLVNGSSSIKGIDKEEKMEPEVIRAELVLPTHLSFKKIQMYEKYPKGQARGRHWKHLKQILQAENFQNYPPDEPNYVNIESPPSMHPCKRICDITGFEAPYSDPRTNLRYARADVFKLVRSLPNEYVQRYLALRNAAIVLK